ncbi:DOMON domain-containing protein FRRS1L-like [Ptychodera flava]|uniref:DOMON domain-containing protein FRRS1L-like n=1 Tax=Ptychodera flava TaxID=63121 RepID=UPI00396A8416
MGFRLPVVCLLACYAVLVDGTVTGTGCGTSKACYSDPEHCDPSVDECEFFLSYKENAADDTVDFEILGTWSDGEGWIAVAFSYDKKMGNDSGVMCISDGSGMSGSVRTFYNDGHVSILGGTDGLSDVSSTVEDETISCSFTRDKSLPGDPRFFDLAMDFYLLMGTGPCSGGTCTEHADLPRASTTKVDFSSTDDIIAGEPDQSSSESHEHSSSESHEHSSSESHEYDHSSSESHERSSSESHEDQGVGAGATINVSDKLSVLVAIMVLAAVVGF